MIPRGTKAIPCKPFGFIAPNVFELFGSPTFSEIVNVFGSKKA
jgi:hypothetical protein